MDGLGGCAALGEFLRRLGRDGGFIDFGQITMEDLQIVEHVVRKDPKVIEQCVISGIPEEDMHKVYCDRKSTRPFQRRTFIDFHSVDNWLRPQIWKHCATSASTHVLPTPR